jgi:hypothetical protein
MWFMPLCLSSSRQLLCQLPIRCSPPRRKPKSKQWDVSSVPRRSARLAKKACNHVPAVAVAQNVLMRKLGIAKDQHVESDNFEAYLKLFMDGL